jgi:hypothetical protein
MRFELTGHCRGRPPIRASVLLAGCAIHVNMVSDETHSTAADRSAPNSPQESAFCSVRLELGHPGVPPPSWGRQQPTKEVVASAVSHIARADFNLHPMSSATFQHPDTPRDNGTQCPLKPLEITGLFGCGLIGNRDPQLLFLVVPVRVVLDRQLCSGRVPGHEFKAFVPAAKLLGSQGRTLAKLVGKARNQLT